MADLKISQLTSATTPLAGTEVLPIVQSSSTKKVATDDLTVKNVRSNATTGILQVAGPAAGTTRVMTTPNANFTAARTDAAQSFTGDQTLSTGSLIQGTAAKGINFTANTAAAGMTSQLLNWYEEGTWTPALNFGGAATGITYATQFGQYTRIGRQVTLTCKVVLTSKGSATGYASITGLPFNAATNVNSMTVVDPASSFTGIVAGGATLLSIATNELYFLQQSLTDRNVMTDTNFGSTADFRFVIVYTV